MDKGKECCTRVLALEEALRESVLVTGDLDEILAPIGADFWAIYQRELKALWSKHLAREQQVTEWAREVASREKDITERAKSTRKALGCGWPSYRSPVPLWRRMR